MSANSPVVSSSAATANDDARRYVNAIRLTAERVQANVQVAQIALGEATTDPAKLVGLAVQAQTAHDNLDGLKADLATAATLPSGQLGDWGAEAYRGLNKIKNSMGALVALTGNLTAPQVASFVTQFQQGQSEWNDAVVNLWNSAGLSSPPTI